MGGNGVGRSLNDDESTTTTTTAAAATATTTSTTTTIGSYLISSGINIATLYDNVFIVGQRAGYKSTDSSHRSACF